MDIPYVVQPRQDTGLYNAKLGIWLFLASEVMLFGALFSSYILLRVGSDPGAWPHGLLNIPIGTFNTTVLILSSVTVVLGWAALQMGDFKKYRRFQAVTRTCALGFLGIKSYEYNEKFTHYEVWRKNDPTRLTGHLEIEGGHHFLTLEKLQKRGLQSIKIIPDQFHYTMPSKEQAEHKKAGAKHSHEPIEIKLSDIQRFSAFVPSHSTYFSIYFTLTALHALHVLGGALVIGYIWGPGAKMWKTDPQRYINRVEVSGLFW